jgi:hypothetical protein
MYEQKNTEYAKNNRSLLNPSFLLDDTKALIMICANGNSRSICIESLEKEERQLINFYITLPDSSYASDSYGEWFRASLTNSIETVEEIKVLKLHSHTTKEFQVETADMCKFVTFMDNACKQGKVIFGDQDADIRLALQSINIESPSFGQPQHQSRKSCAIS